MAEEIVIDKANFFNRLSSFYAAWKADRRSGNTVFGGVGSIVILMGKTDEANSFQKSNAMHVSQPQSPCETRGFDLLTFCDPSVLVAWLRVSSYALRFHNRSDVCSDYREKRYVIRLD